VLLSHDWFMESPYDRYASVEERAELVDRVQRRELEKLREHEQLRDAERRKSEQDKRVRELFNDPGQAAEMLAQASSKLDAPGGISSILLDNSTVDHALRYFKDAHRDGSHASLPTRPRLMLLAVADFVNAAILYEHVLTGPETRATKYAPQEQSLNIARSVSGTLSERETFAVLALAKATAAEAAREPEAVNTASALLGTSLKADKVLYWLNAIDPTQARKSGETFYNDSIPTLNVLGRSQSAVTAVDQADGYRTKDRSAYSSLYDWGINPRIDPERIAAHLMYRTHVYLYLADLLGFPYSADALGKNLIPSQPRRGFAERVTTLVGEAQNTRDDQVNDLLGFEAFKVRIPLVLKYVLCRASTPSEVLEITLETRESRPARRFREYCARVDTAIAEGKRDDVARACAELSSYGVRLEAELPGPRTDGQEAVQEPKNWSASAHLCSAPSFPDSRSPPGRPATGSGAASSPSSNSSPAPRETSTKSSASSPGSGRVDNRAPQTGSPPLPGSDGTPSRCGRTVSCSSFIHPSPTPTSRGPSLSTSSVVSSRARCGGS
jgi:hypothetical protein